MLPWFRPGFPKLAVHAYLLAIYQFARVPPKLPDIILQKITRSIKPKPRLKTKKKVFSVI